VKQERGTGLKIQRQTVATGKALELPDGEFPSETCRKLNSSLLS